MSISHEHRSVISEKIDFVSTIRDFIYINLAKQRSQYRSLRGSWPNCFLFRNIFSNNVLILKIHTVHIVEAYFLWLQRPVCQETGEATSNITINRHVLFCYSKDQNSVPCLHQTAELQIEIELIELGNSLLIELCFCQVVACN